MTNLGQRIKQIREEQHLTQEAFGQKIDLTKQAVANVENCRCNPSIEFIGKLLCNFDVNLNWLFSGKGSMFNPPQFEQVEDELTQKVEQILKRKGLI